MLQGLGIFGAVPCLAITHVRAAPREGLGWDGVIEGRQPLEDKSRYQRLTCIYVICGQRDCWPLVTACALWAGSQIHLVNTSSSVTSGQLLALDLYSFTYFYF